MASSWFMAVLLLVMLYCLLPAALAIYTSLDQYHNHHDATVTAESDTGSVPSDDGWKVNEDAGRQDQEPTSELRKAVATVLKAYRHPKPG